MLAPSTLAQSYDDDSCDDTFVSFERMRSNSAGCMPVSVHTARRGRSRRPSQRLPRAVARQFSGSFRRSSSKCVSRFRQLANVAQPQLVEQFQSATSWTEI